MSKIVAKGIQNIYDAREVVGVVCIPNRCCPGKPVVIQRVKWGRKRWYFAQCGCGGITFAQTKRASTIEEAITMYRALGEDSDSFAADMAEEFNCLICEDEPLVRK